jgi:hypothetical protein
MAETLTLSSDRVDDLPLVLAPLERLGLQALLDEPCPPLGTGWA